MEIENECKTLDFYETRLINNPEAQIRIKKDLEIKGHKVHIINGILYIDSKKRPHSEMDITILS